MKIRPFMEHVQRERDLPLLEISGRIESEQFVVSVLGYEVTLDTAMVGEDESGPYALVKEYEKILPNGFQMRIETEFDENLPPGLVIRVFFEGVSREAAKQHLQSRGIDPRNVNLVAPHERSFSVYFGANGKTNGTSSSYLDGGKKPVIN